MDFYGLRLYDIFLRDEQTEHVLSIAVFIDIDES